MTVAVHEVVLGIDHCYLLVSGEAAVLIDGGAWPGLDRELSRALRKLAIEPEQIRLIVLTHGHWDHIGAARDIQRLTRAEIAMHRAEREWLEWSRPLMPPPISSWGRLLAGGMELILPFIRLPKATVDIALDDEELSLEPYGIAGRVIPTPGHSRGSVSVLLDSGEAFVGDMAMNGLPLRLGPGLPIFAEDLALLKQSWRCLLAAGARTIYPAHGKPFPAEVMRRAL